VTRAWLAVGAWLVVQLTLTSLPGSAMPVVSVSIYDSGHLVMYGVLGALVARALGRSEGSAGRLALVWAAIAVFGVLDEWHQRFIPGRYPSVTDMVFDAAGAAAGLWLGALLLRRRWAAWLR
jgi:VanZ family protein